MKAKSGNACFVAQNRCKGSSGLPLSFEAIVNAYIGRYRKSETERLSNFRTQSSLPVAIRNAAWAGKRDHQRRVSPQQLTFFTNKLLAKQSSLQSCSNFEELQDAIVRQKVHGIGGLTCYDTALL